MSLRWVLVVVSMSLVSTSYARGESITILVAYDSRTGNTETLARAVVEGIASVDGTRAVLRKHADVVDDEILGADGVVVGSPVHWASLSADTKAFLDRIGNLFVARKELGPDTAARHRTAGAFVTGGSVSSGKELARLAILSAFLNMRFVIVGAEDAAGFGTLGAAATTGESDPGLSEAELAEARRFGERFAQITRKLAH